MHLPAGLVASLIAIAITIYFWRRNIKGLHESSGDALRIMQITTVMVVILILWCLLTLLERGGALRRQNHQPGISGARPPQGPVEVPQ